IQFTKEIEENGKIPFLDCLVTRNNNKLKTTIYRKPTHTDRLLDQSSYNPTSHKATTIRTLTRRAQLEICLSLEHQNPAKIYRFHSLHDRRFMSQAGRTRYFARSATRARSARRGKEKN
ncbi:unnamed protein product, partial [Porites lobata]